MFNVVCFSLLFKNSRKVLNVKHSEKFFLLFLILCCDVNLAHSCFVFLGLMLCESVSSYNGIELIQNLFGEAYFKPVIKIGVAFD